MSDPLSSQRSRVQSQPKKIMQETFDETVKENMEDFDMTIEDAIQDAIQQFKSQGVDISNILIGSCNFKGEHPILKCLKELEKIPTNDEIVVHLDFLTESFKNDKECRILAGRNGGVEILLELIASSCNTIATRAFQGLGLLCLYSIDNSDFIKENGMRKIVDCLRSENGTIDFYQNAFHCLYIICTKNESNKCSFVSLSGINALMDSLETYSESSECIQEITSVMRIITIADDPRQDFSQAHDVVRQLISRDILSVLFKLNHMYFENAPIVSNILSIVKHLAITSDNCKLIVDQDGLSIVSNLLKRHEKDVSVVKRALSLLRNVAGTDEYKAHLIKNGQLKLILSMMEMHSKNDKVQEQACATIACMALRHPQNCTDIVDVGALYFIAKALHCHQKSEVVLRQGSLAIRNLVARNPEFRSQILEENVEPILRFALQLTSCKDAAYSALRDLGCNIRLSEAPKISLNFNPTLEESDELHSSMIANSQAPFAIS